jgi:hypothetical protein
MRVVCEYTHTPTSPIRANYYTGRGLWVVDGRVLAWLVVGVWAVVGDNGLVKVTSATE